MREDHYEEDGRCGYCFEEWPCGGSAGIASSGIHGWALRDRDRRFEIKRTKERLEEVRINELFDKLGYPMMRYPTHSQTMTLTREQILILLERINDCEHGE